MPITPTHNDGLCGLSLLAMTRFWSAAQNQHSFFTRIDGVFLNKKSKIIVKQAQNSNIKISKTSFKAINSSCNVF